MVLVKVTALAKYMPNPEKVRTLNQIFCVAYICVILLTVRTDLLVTLWRSIRLHTHQRQFISDIVQYSNSRWLDHPTWQDSQSQSVIQL